MEDKTSEDGTVEARTLELKAHEDMTSGDRASEYASEYECSIRKMLAKVDHTLLKPFATWEDIQRLCGEAVRYHTASVCIPPSYVRRVRETYGESLNICTVVGFPLGYSVAEAKLLETRQALEEGCGEIDMVVNIGDVKDGRYDKVEEEIRLLKEACGTHVLKVIIEACYLTKEEKIALCRAVTAAGADYIKTSTGFGTGGAVREDIELFREHIGPQVKIKAAGGISTLEDLKLFLDLGCDRVGTSRAVGLAAQILEESPSGTDRSDIGMERGEV